MIRAVFFDFYSVWTPDKFALYQANAEQISPEVSKAVSDVIESYYHGKVDVAYVAENLRMRLNNPDINVNQFSLKESDISPEIIKFMQGLHGHFLKLGILANLGIEELKLLNGFNQHNQLFESIASPLSLKIDRPLLSRELFSQALQAIGEPLDSCVWVSGNLSYLEFAQSLGIAVIEFEGLPKLKEYLDRLITSELPK